MSTKRKPARRNRRPVEEWRARIPEIRHVVEEVGPRVAENAHARLIANVPEPWKLLVAAMRKKVHEGVDQATHFRKESRQERLGYAWNSQVGRLSEMVEYLLAVIRSDILGNDRATIASMVLVKQALLQLALELQEGGTQEGRGDGEEMRYRVQQALFALLPRFDDVHLRRLRALQVAEHCARTVRHPLDEEEVEANVEAMREFKANDADWEEKHRDWLRIDQPALLSVFAQSELTKVDERFASLDPLVIMEEFAEAQTETRGGKANGGEGRVGPVRAVARLAVMCCALDYGQRNGETFDDAVDRARTNLLITRSRIRKAMTSFPGQKVSSQEIEPELS